MHVRQQRTLVELLRARRHVDGRVPREEVDRLEADFEDLAGHDGEIFDAWHLRFVSARNLLGGCWKVGMGGVEGVGWRLGGLRG